MQAMRTLARGLPLLSESEEEPLEAKSATVTEIHEYPLRPEGYAEPLFHSHESRKEILDHFARSSWLSRGIELEETREAPRPARTPSRASTAIREVLASWREVDRWWETGGGVDVVWRLVEDRGGRQEVRAEQAPGRIAA